MAKTRADQVRNFDQLNDSQLIGIGTVAEICDVSQSTVSRWVKEGKFPAPVKISSWKRWPVRVVRKIARGGNV